MGQLKQATNRHQNPNKTTSKLQQKNNNKFTQKSYNKQSQKNLQKILLGNTQTLPKGLCKIPSRNTPTTKHTNKQTPKQTNTDTLTTIQQHTDSRLTTHQPASIHKIIKALKNSIKAIKNLLDHDIMRLKKFAWSSCCSRIVQ